LLAREIISPRQTLLEVQEYVDARIPRMPAVATRADWEREAARLRNQTLERVVYRGATSWRDAPGGVTWLETVKGGPGYRIRKLRYEAVPGLWIPALLYEPEKLSGKVPVALAVNGHDGNGKAADYKQARCINMARRGMLVLNVEWLGMGQLRAAGYRHGCMNQLDLCGASGLSVFYLSMKRGLDVLLAHDHADPTRVVVSGLSGGGWQTIVISALDTRVTLTNPVAGYSSFRTRLRHFKDLGDSEQTPNDLATVADYTHLTALMAPRATLLSYNARDNCCFEAGYALPPLVDAALPIFRLYGKENALATHVNDDPGDHNFGKDNRQALYRMLGAQFFAQERSYSAEEIPCGPEIQSRDALAVELPRDNADFNTLARGLSQSLPRVPPAPSERDAARKWQQEQRERLRAVLKARELPVRATKIATEEKAGHKAAYWQLKVGENWSVPAVELARGEPRGTVILVNDAGRKADGAAVERWLAAGWRVLAVDLFFFGEARIQERDWLFALLVATVGERPLGIQASQLAAVARWSQREHGSAPAVAVTGPRLATVVLAAAALEPEAIRSVEVNESLGSLKQLIEENRTVDQMPEQFCFGLLEVADLKHMAALVVPRPLHFVKPGDRVKAEMGQLKAWYATLGAELDPLR
jgi:dienelactone hydrolase